MRNDTKQGVHIAFGQWVAERFQVRPSESRLVALILLYTIGTFTANVLVYTAAYALFLAKFDAQSLPYIYIGESMVSTLLTLLYLRLSQRTGLSDMLFGQLFVMAMTALGYRWGLMHWTGGWFIFSLPIWYAVMNNQINSAFWSLLGRLFNIQQSKRLFGLLIAGQEVAIVSMGLLIPSLVAWVGTPNLLLLAVLSMAGAGWALQRIVRSAPVLHRSEMAASEETPTADERLAAHAKPSLWADPYIRLIFGVLLLFGLSDNLIDNLFYREAGSRIIDQNQLATFLGAFTATVGGVNLFCQLFLASPMLRRFGVYTINLLTPVILLSVSIPLVLVGLFARQSPLLFGLAVALNMSRRVTDKFDTTAGNLLYQPLPATMRAQTQTVIDGIFVPVVNGLAGLLLLYLNNVLRFSSVQLALVLLPLLAIWTVITAQLGRRYGQRVQQALRQRLIQGNSDFQPDRASLDTLRQHLTDAHPGAVLYALDLLAATDDTTLIETLPALLHHPSPAVRLDVLARMERLCDPGFLPAVQHCMQSDGEAQVQAVALQTWAALGGLTEAAAIDHYLGESAPSLRQAAMIGLLRSGALEGILAVGETLTKLIASVAVEDRIFAAQVLGGSGLTGLHRPLLKLLRDGEPKVQQAALNAVAKIQPSQLWPVVVEALAEPRTRATAQTALFAGGEAALPALQQASSQTGEVTAQNRYLWLTLVKACGRIGSPQSRTLLVAQLACPDVTVRTQALTALHRGGYQADAATRPLLEAGLQAEIASARSLLIHLVSLGEPKAGPRLPLGNELHADLAQLQARLLLWLALLYDPAVFQRVRTALAPGLRRISTAEQRDYALETLDLLLPKAVSKPLLFLLDDLPPAQQLKALVGETPPALLALPLQLATLISSDERWVTPWLRTVALFTVANTLPPALCDSTLQAAVAQVAVVADPLVQETALWVMARLNDGRVGAQAQGRLPMPQTLLTIEKVLILQRVEIFVATPAAILVEMAARLRELTAPAGSVIFTKGAPGDSMYLIVTGAVEALDGERSFAQMREREIFGEMALLDGAPRTATIRAAQPTHLLCLDQASFYELMDEHIEIARGVIHVLLQRLRARTADLKQLQAQLAARGRSDAWASR
ncbi:MAG: Npt1/Npt2 family nucleotide transporter [Caldilineaceae bacterium]